MKTRNNFRKKSLFYLYSVGIAIMLYSLASCAKTDDTYIFPEKEYPLLFNDVQKNKVFKDDKTFPDCVPKSTPWVINFKYYVWKLFHSKSDLPKFVNENFELPSLYIDSIVFKSKIKEHLAIVSNALLIATEKQHAHTSLIPLPNNFVIPGGRFRETYYWDTYFTLLGYADYNQKNVIYKVTENMAYLINKFGFIPNGNRSYYLSRSQPPFFSLIVELNATLFSDSMYIHFLPELEKEYTYWMQKELNAKQYKHYVALNDTVALNRYYDNLNQPRVEMYNEDINTYTKKKDLIEDTINFYRNIRSTAESGWDFSSRWFGNTSRVEDSRTLDILPVDLNCLLFHLEKTIYKAYSLKDDKRASIYKLLANKRKENINRFFWNDSAGFYFDYNYREMKQTPKYTLAGVFPLFLGISDTEKALKVSKNIRNKFLQPGGVVTTLINSGQQWDYPNGWAPLQWTTIQALKKYRYNGLADTIRNRWIRTNETYFNRTHKMLEKYNVVDTTFAPRDGEYPTQDGFGWTNGVYIDLTKNDK